MARLLTPVDEIRARFTALQRPLVFFDAPGGTQVPDSVIEAIASYLRESNANLGGPFATSLRSDALVADSHDVAARLLGASAREVAFGANMTTLNFALSRASSRDWAAGDEIVCTRLDHDGNIAPWLELAHDKGLVSASPTSTTTAGSTSTSSARCSRTARASLPTRGRRTPSGP